MDLDFSTWLYNQMNPDIWKWNNYAMTYLSVSNFLNWCETHLISINFYFHAAWISICVWYSKYVPFPWVGTCQTGFLMIWNPNENEYIPTPFVNWIGWWELFMRASIYAPACDDGWPELLWMSRFPLLQNSTQYTLKVIGKWAFYRRHFYIGHSESIFVLWFRRDLNYKWNKKPTLIFSVDRWQRIICFDCTQFDAC